MSASRSGERVDGGGVPGTLGEEQELLGESLMGRGALWHASNFSGGYLDLT